MYLSMGAPTDDTCATDNVLKMIVLGSDQHTVLFTVS